MLLIGLSAAAAGLTAGVILGLGVVISCGGSDAGAPSDSRLCDWHWASGITLAGCALAMGGPLYGTVASLGTARWRPLWVGIGIGFGGLVLLVWLLSLL